MPSSVCTMNGAIQDHPSSAQTKYEALKGPRTSPLPLGGEAMSEFHHLTQKERPPKWCTAPGMIIQKLTNPYIPPYGTGGEVPSTRLMANHQAELQV